MANKIQNPVQNGVTRTADKYGQGHYGASRGTRTHKGVDIGATVGQSIVSPIDGKVERKAYPYASDLTYTGVLIKGSGKHKDIEVRLYYLTPGSGVVGSSITAGQTVGVAQNLASKYPGITNHIHLEVKQNGVNVNPMNLIK